MATDNAEIIKHLDDVEGDLSIALGTTVAWSKEKLKKPDLSRGVIGEIQYNGFFGQYALPDEDEYISASALLASIEPTALFVLDTSVTVEHETISVTWICHIVDGEFYPSTDQFITIETEEDRVNVTDMLRDAKQTILDNSKVYVFGHEKDLIEYIKKNTTVDDFSSFFIGIKKNKKSNYIIPSFLVLASLMSVAGYLYYESNEEKRIEDIRKQQAENIYRAAKETITQQIEIEFARSFLEEAFSLPGRVNGYKVASVVCSINECTTIYKKDTALVPSLALSNLSKLARNVNFDVGTKNIIVSRSMDFPKSDVIPPSDQKVVSLQWVDFTNIIEKKATTTVSPLSKLAGSGLVSANEASGTWVIEGVSRAYILSILEGLNKIEGVRFDSFYYSEGKTRIGGVYAINAK